MPYKELLSRIFKDPELLFPFCVFVLAGLNPASTAIILFQSALLKCYRKRCLKLQLDNEERIELAKLAVVIPQQWLIRWAPEFKPDTYRTWFRKLVAMKHNFLYRKKKRNVGRPPKGELIERFVIRACRENPDWGDQIIAENAS